jgi:hypothetical protein
MPEDIRLEDGCIAQLIATNLNARGQYTFDGASFRYVSEESIRRAARPPAT